MLPIQTCLAGDSNCETDWNRFGIFDRFSIILTPNNRPLYATLHPLHPSLPSTQAWTSTMIISVLISQSKLCRLWSNFNYVHLHLTQRWSSPLTEPIDAKQCSGANDPLTSLWRKKVPHFTEVLSGTSHRKKRLRKSFIYHFHQFNNLKSLFGCLTRCQFFLQYLQNLQYQDPVKKKQY